MVQFQILGREERFSWIILASCWLKTLILWGNLKEASCTKKKVVYCVHPELSSAGLKLIQLCKNPFILSDPKKVKVLKVPSHWSKSTSFLIGWIWVYKLQPIWTDSFSLQHPNWKHLKEDLQIPWRWENCCMKLWKLRGRKPVSQLKWI